MKQTYIAEIDGEAIAAFPAPMSWDANALVNGRDGIAYEMIGRERPNGTALWDRESPVTPRLATDQEIQTVRETFAALGFATRPPGKGCVPNTNCPDRSRLRR